MDQSISRMIYTAAGVPPMGGSTVGQCRLCGYDGAGVAFESWVKDTFTDLDKLKPGAIACHACLFCSSDQCPGLADRVGKEKAQKFRNYSHIVDAVGQWHPLSKGDKARMRDLLRDDPPVALIATSGQKHLFFRGHSGLWIIEEQPMRPDPHGLALVLSIVTPMLEVFSKAELESGRYDQRRIMAYGPTPWRTAEERLRIERGGPLLALAIFLAQKEESDGSSADRG
jgi:hypothetical protein